MHLTSMVRVAGGFTFLAVTVTVQLVVLVVLMPLRNLRIRACNVYGRVVGRVLLRMTGSPLTLIGEEELRADRQAIYVGNHTSSLDAMLAMSLSPVGTVGVAKKEIVWIPFFGQLYLLSGHILLDRGNRERAIATMTAAASLVERHRLSLFMWPEGTRSVDGRLQPFKKGLVHLALATGLPVVPIVITGAHKTWEKHQMRVVPHPIRVEVLPAIDTSRWATMALEDALEEVHAAFVAHLPPDQLSSDG